MRMIQDRYATAGPPQFPAPRTTPAVGSGAGGGATETVEDGVLERCRVAEQMVPRAQRARRAEAGSIKEVRTREMTNEERIARDRARRALYSDAAVSRRMKEAASAAARKAAAPGLQLLPHAFGAVPPAALEEAAIRMYAVYGGVGPYCWEGLLSDEVTEARGHVKSVLELDGV